MFFMELQVCNKCIITLALLLIKLLQLLLVVLASTLASRGASRVVFAPSHY